LSGEQMTAGQHHEGNGANSQPQDERRYEQLDPVSLSVQLLGLPQWFA
jgi:hypothetical protein